MKPNHLQAAVALVGGEVSGTSDGSEIVYLSGQTPPTKSQINAKLKELEAEYDSQSYARLRQEKYPNTNDLIVALWEKLVEGRTESADALEVKRQEIKKAHPKPE